MTSPLLVPPGDLAPSSVGSRPRTDPSAAAGSFDAVLEQSAKGRAQHGAAPAIPAHQNNVAQLTEEHGPASGDPRPAHRSPGGRDAAVRALPSAPSAALTGLPAGDPGNSPATRPLYDGRRSSKASLPSRSEPMTGAMPSDSKSGDLRRTGDSDEPRADASREGMVALALGVQPTPSVLQDQPAVPQAPVEPLRGGASRPKVVAAPDPSRGPQDVPPERLTVAVHSLQTHFGPAPASFTPLGPLEATEPLPPPRYQSKLGAAVGHDVTSERAVPEPAIGRGPAADTRQIETTTPASSAAANMNAGVAQAVGTRLFDGIMQAIRDPGSAPAQETVSSATADQPSVLPGPVRVLKLELSPAVLGPVTVTVAIREDAIRVRLEAHRAGTASIVELERERLAERLAEAGFAVEELVVARPELPAPAGPVADGAGERRSPSDSQPSAHHGNARHGNPQGEEHRSADHLEDMTERGVATGSPALSILQAPRTRIEGSRSLGSV